MNRTKQNTDLNNKQAVVVSSQSQESEKGAPLSTDKEVAIRALTALSMMEDVARRLVADNDPDYVLRVAQLAQDKRNPPGWAVSALEENWQFGDQAGGEAEQSDWEAVIATLAKDNERRLV